jgi:hypothetical protein
MFQALFFRHTFWIATGRVEPHQRDAIQAGAGIAAFRRSFTMRARPIVSVPGCWLGFTLLFLGQESGLSGGLAMKNFSRAFVALALMAVVSGCAGILRNPDIADVKQNSGHYSDRTVTLDGTVTSSWGVPLVPFKMYKVDDGTGEITVLSRGGNRTPVKGSHVKVKGVVRDVAVFNGMPLGLHLEERDLDIRRN